MGRSLLHDRPLVLWLSLAQLISWGTLFYTFALVASPIEQELDLNRAQSSLAFSLCLLAEGLCAYPIGRWIDRGHERLVMTAGSVLAAAGLLAHSFVTSLGGFYAAWTIVGIAMAATLYTPVFAVVTRRFPTDFRRAIITLTFLGGLASTVFIPLTSWLIASLGWRHALGCLAVLHLVACVPIHGVLLRDARLNRSASVNAQDAVALAPYLKSAPFLLIGIFVVFMMAVTVALPAHMVSLLRENGLKETWVIVVPAGIGVLQVFGRVLLYVFERRFDVNLANRLIPCLVPAGLVALLLAPWASSQSAGMGMAMLGLFVCLYGMGNGMLTIVKGTAVAQYVSRDYVASLNGALGVPLALARAAAPLALGLLWTRPAGYSYGLWLLLAMSIAAILALLAAQRKSLI